MSARPARSLHALRTVGLAVVAALAALPAVVDAADGHGELLVAACQACHGRAGISASPDIPNLAGQKQAYLANQLTAFRAGERKNELMAAIAGQLKDADIAALALYWSSLPGPVAPAGAASGVARLASRMTFPAGFPDGFTVYQSDSEVGGSTVTLRYANAVALAAARESRPLPDGAAIVVVNRAVRNTPQGFPVFDPGGHPVAGLVTSYAAMAVKTGWGDAVPALLRNGDWDYAMFGADGQRRDGLNTAACLACHKPLEADSHVFTMKALRAAAAR